MFTFLPQKYMKSYKLLGKLFRPTIVLNFVCVYMGKHIAINKGKIITTGIFVDSHLQGLKLAQKNLKLHTSLFPMEQ